MTPAKRGDRERVGEIGNVLRAYRDAAGLSTRDMEMEIGVSPATINRIEHGHPCDQRTMLKLLNWLFGGESNE